MTATEDNGWDYAVIIHQLVHAAQVEELLLRGEIDLSRKWGLRQVSQGEFSKRVSMLVYICIRPCVTLTRKRRVVVRSCPSCGFDEKYYVYGMRGWIPSSWPEDCAGASLPPCWSRLLTCHGGLYVSSFPLARTANADPKFQILPGILFHGQRKLETHSALRPCPCQRSPWHLKGSWSGTKQEVRCVCNRTLLAELAFVCDWRAFSRIFLLRKVSRTQIRKQFMGIQREIVLGQRELTWKRGYHKVSCTFTKETLELPDSESRIPCNRILITELSCPCGTSCWSEWIRLIGSLFLLFSISFPWKYHKCDSHHHWNDDSISKMMQILSMR